MLNKEITQYINYNESKFTWGQKADGTWYCKEFKSDTIEEANNEINEINEMLNEYNKKENETPETSIKLKTKKKKDTKTEKKD